MSENKKRQRAAPFKYKMDDFFSAQLFAGNETCTLEPLRISVCFQTQWALSLSEKSCYSNNAAQLKSANRKQ